MLGQLALAAGRMHTTMDPRPFVSVLREEDRRIWSPMKMGWLENGACDRT